MNVGSRKRVFFDTNVIVYSHDNGSPRKRDKARALIAEAYANGCGVVSGQVLSETFVTLTKKVGISPDAAAEEISCYSRFRVVDISADLVLRAIQMQSEFQLSYWDSLIVAAAQFASCTVLWSEDLNDGQKYGDVVVRNPFVN